MRELRVQGGSLSSPQRHHHRCPSTEKPAGGYPVAGRLLHPGILRSTRETGNKYHTGSYRRTKTNQLDGEYPGTSKRRGAAGHSLRRPDRGRRCEAICNAVVLKSTGCNPPSSNRLIESSSINPSNTLPKKHSSDRQDSMTPHDYNHSCREPRPSVGREKLMTK